MNPCRLLAVAVVAGFGIADLPVLAKTPSSLIPHMDGPRARTDGLTRLTFTTAPVDTFVLRDYRWGSFPGDPHGWTSVDLSVRPDTAFHVDDFAGMSGTWYAPISGSKSLWCGVRALPGYPDCAATTCLPGYLNDWEQRFESIAFPRTGDVTVSFRARWDSEPGYDRTRLEYLDSGGTWREVLLLEGRGDLPVSVPIPGSDLPATVKLRLRFDSDGAWSDEDCLYPSDGAIIIDELTVSDATGILSYQDFESEPAGARTTSDGHWTAGIRTPFGDYAQLYPGMSALQQDPCVSVASAIWTFFVGSTATYWCGGFPDHPAIPYGNVDGLYMTNEIWSPLIDWNEDINGGAIPGTANGALLDFDVYRDMQLEGLVFYVWHVRAFDGEGCPGPWRDRGFVYFGGQKDWFHPVFEFGDLIPSGTEKIQVAIGLWDMCEYWCGFDFNCHSNAPMFGNVRVSRLAVNGPRWVIRDIDQFQDNFAEVSGPNAGTARADMALSVTSGSSPSIIPGDSSVVRASDVTYGLALESANSRAAVYSYVSVSPPQPSKTGASLVDDLRYPVVGSWTDTGGTEWTLIQCDSVYLNNAPVLNAFCLDLNDAVFEPGDIVSFFYGARNTNGVESYAHGSNLGSTTLDREAAAIDPSEFSILPYSGGDILYVDGMDGRGSQPYFDTAFQSLGILGQVDRYDVRGPTSAVGNRPAGRVKDVSQLLAAYRKILWDTGDLVPGLGNGSGTPEKTNDWQLVADFLNGLTNPGGVYIGGDDAGSTLHTLSGSAATFQTTWMTSKLTSGNARQAGHGISPAGVSQGGVFTSDPTFIVNGGCPLINDFDVLEPLGNAVNEITYNAGTPTSTNGAVLSQITTNAQGQDVGVLFGGFSFAYIIDDDTDGISDRAAFLHDTITWLGNLVNAPTPVASRRTNRLDANYPNPFNPATTISFSLRQRGSATLVVYNVAGARVRVLADDALPAGAHTRVWDGRNDAGAPVASGVYFYRLTAPGFTSTRKMVMLR